MTLIYVFCIVSKTVTLVTNTVLFARWGSSPLSIQSKAIALIEKHKTQNFALNVQSTKKKQESNYNNNNLIIIVLTHLVYQSYHVIM